MSCRALSQPLFVEGLVSGYGNEGGFLDRIEKAFDWPPLKALPAPIHASRRAGRAIRPSPQLSLRPAKNPKNLNCKKLPATIVCDNPKAMVLCSRSVGSGIDVRASEERLCVKLYNFDMMLMVGRTSRISLFSWNCGLTN